MSETPGWTRPGDAGTPQYGSPPPYGQLPPQQPPAIKPGIVALRPLGLGELYDGAFQAIRRNPRTMLATAAAVITVIALVDVCLLYTSDAADDLLCVDLGGRRII